MFKYHKENDTLLHKRVQKAIVNKRSLYTIKKVEGEKLIHYNNKIMVPSLLKEGVMSWYHNMLVHPVKDNIKAA